MPLSNFADEIVARSKVGSAFKRVDKDQKIARVASAARVDLGDSTPGLIMVITFGDLRGADPAFVHVNTGEVRPITRAEGEAKGFSAHVLFRLQPHDDNPVRYGVLIEEVPSVGRTIIERLVNSEFAAIAEDRGLNFRRDGGKKDIKARPIANLSGQKSAQFEKALEGGRFSPVELIDTKLLQTGLDEAPGFKIKSRQVIVKVKPTAGETMRAALDRLRPIAEKAGYDHLRVRWRSDSAKLETALLPTALQDLGEALYVKRETVTVDTPLTECDPSIRQDLLRAMIAIFA